MMTGHHSINMNFETVEKHLKGIRDSRFIFSHQQAQQERLQYFLPAIALNRYEQNRFTELPNQAETTVDKTASPGIGGGRIVAGFSSRYRQDNSPGRVDRYRPRGSCLKSLFPGGR